MLDLAALPPLPVIPVVGIGASAGGLSALQTFFGALLPGSCSGVAFVLVQHLAPGHPSLLAELLGRVTHLRVHEVEAHERVEAGCVYVIPPNRDLTLTGGILELSEPAEGPGHRRPIDVFLQSLAQDQQELATAIILSGTGSDGTAGLRAVKQQGGLVMAQLPESCEFAAMPAAAIATGLADYILAPEDMPAQLDASARSQASATPRPDAYRANPDRLPKDILAQILGSVRAVTGHDFTHYKPNTIVRRVERRMALHCVNDPALYVRLLENQPDENAALLSDLLIGVTSFFRDPAAFEDLTAQIKARLFPRGLSAETRTPIRVWVPGCSSGEEAYSIAILLEEQRRACGQGTPFQVFATDLDAAALERARTGQYPASIAGEVDEGRLTRFFSRLPGSGEFRINKEIRNSLVFSQHNILKDPPFSRLDLISCRNLMIYLDAEAQRQLIRIFHYSLNHGGLLFLGTSETTAGQPELFTSLDRKSKLYVRNDHARFHTIPVPRLAPRRTGGAPALDLPSRRPPPDSETSVSRPAFRAMVERALLAQYAAAGVLVDDKGDILYVHGRTGHYLEPAPGDAAAMNIRRMAREGLRESLAVALLRAMASHEPAEARGVQVKTNGSFERIDLSVVPLPGPADEGEVYLVVLVEAPPAAAPAETASASPGTDARIAELTGQLQAKEEYLRASSQELEATNEALRSANEELQSVNEEMQSSNEELETSQEELQSVNEELTTVNAELQQNLKYLSQANNDMNNLLAGTDIGTIFVDHDLRILRFTPSITRIVNLISSDVGRPVGHIVSNLESYDRLVEDLQTTLDTLAPMEVEVRTKPGSWFLMRIRPYRTLENVIEGAVITFTDVTQLRRVQDEQREADVKFRVLFESMPTAALFYDAQGRVAGLNAAAAKLLGLSPERAQQLVEGKLGWKLLETSGKELAPADYPAPISLRTGKPLTGTSTGICISGKQEVCWVRQEAFPLFRLGDDKPFQVYVTLTGIPEPSSGS